MKDILDKIQSFQEMIENKTIDLSKFEGQNVNVYNIDSGNEIFIDLEFHNVDINEMLQLAYQENLKGNLDKYNVIPSYYSLSWDVTDNLSVLFWSKKNQEPKIQKLCVITTTGNQKVLTRTKTKQMNVEFVENIAKVIIALQSATKQI